MEGQKHELISVDHTCTQMPVSGGYYSHGLLPGRGGIPVVLQKEVWRNTDRCLQRAVEIEDQLDDTSSCLCKKVINYIVPFVQYK